MPLFDNIIEPVTAKVDSNVNIPVSSESIEPKPSPQRNTIPADVLNAAIAEGKYLSYIRPKVWLIFAFYRYWTRCFQSYWAQHKSFSSIASGSIACVPMAQRKTKSRTNGSWIATESKFRYVSKFWLEIFHSFLMHFLNAGSDRSVTPKGGLKTESKDGLFP